MATTYTLIASSTVGSGGAANIDFTSIPATYTDLLIKISSRTDPAQLPNSLLITFNNNTSNRSSRRLNGSGSAAASFSSATLTYASESQGASTTGSTFANTEIYIPNYAGSNNKSYSADGVMENNATESYVSLWAGLWADTAAITSVKLIPDTGNFVQYSTFYLYGISSS